MAAERLSINPLRRHLVNELGAETNQHEAKLCGYAPRTYNFWVSRGIPARTARVIANRLGLDFDTLWPDAIDLAENTFHHATITEWLIRARALTYVTQSSRLAIIRIVSVDHVTWSGTHLDVVLASGYTTRLTMSSANQAFVLYSRIVDEIRGEASQMTTPHDALALIET